MVTTEELRAAAHRKVDEADETTLISILGLSPEHSDSIRLSKADMEELYRIRQRRIDGEPGFTLNEIFAGIQSKRDNAGL